MNRRSVRIWLGGFCCGLIVLGAAVLIVRTFFVQGLVARVETVSGSMAPWLYGPHGEAKCGDCGFDFVFDALDAPTREHLDCPNCGGRTATMTSTRTLSGEQVLIDRRAFASRAPQRWEPVVFECQEQAGEVCIKRVVGVPGDEIEIRGGDVYIDGQIARKSLEQQRSMAILVHDSRWRTEDAGATRSGWRTSGNKTSWQLAPGRFQYRTTADEQPNVDRGGIRYRHVHRGRPSPILDDYAYNQDVSRALNTTSDVMLQFELVAHGEGEIALLANAHGHRFDVQFQTRTRRPTFLVISKDGQEVKRNMTSFRIGDHAKVELSFVDRQMLLAVDDEVAFKHAIDEPMEKEFATSLAIDGKSMDAALSNVRVWRDVYYTRPRTALWAIDEPYKLGEDEYFVLGDNSPISADSRNWARPGLASKYIVGKPIRSQRNE